MKLNDSHYFFNMRNEKFIFLIFKKILAPLQLFLSLFGLKIKFCKGFIILLKHQFLITRIQWGNLWKKYCQKNSNTIKSDLRVLKRGLDSGSKEVVEKIFNRYVFLLPTSENALVMNYQVFDEDERKLQKKVRNKRKAYKKKHNLSFKHYEDCVFYFHSGLKIIDCDHLRNYIKNKFFIDAGAFIGDSALTFLEYKPKVILSFEPSSKNYHYLKQTIILNNLDKKINALKMGVGSKNEKLFLTEDFLASSLVKQPTGQRGTTINVVKIDDFIQKNCSNNSIGLIKLDIEGNELNAIKGAKEIIKKDKPIILCSIHHTPQDFFKVKPLLRSYYKNYAFLIRKLDPFHPVYETVLIAYPKHLNIKPNESS